MSETIIELPTHGVNLTEVAQTKVRTLLEQEGRTDLRLRIAVQPGGCSGLIYQLYFDERVLDGVAERFVETDDGRVGLADHELQFPDAAREEPLLGGFHDQAAEALALMRGIGGDVIDPAPVAVMSDHRRGDEPARLVRVRDGEATVVYESPGTGNAFLSAPRCGGTDLTVTAFSQAGDEQVTAGVG